MLKTITLGNIMMESESHTYIWNCQGWDCHKCKLLSYAIWRLSSSLTVTGVIFCNGKQLNKVIIKI